VGIYKLRSVFKGSHPLMFDILNKKYYWNLQIFMVDSGSENSILRLTSFMNGPLKEFLKNI